MNVLGQSLSSLRWEQRHQQAVFRTPDRKAVTDILPLLLQPTGWPLEAAAQAQPPDGSMLLGLSEIPYLHGVLAEMGSP